MSGRATALCLIFAGCAGRTPPLATPRVRPVTDTAGNTFVARVVRTEEDAAIVIEKTAESGTPLWSRRVPGGALSSPAYALAVDGRGALLVAWSVRGPEGLVDAWIRKYAADGRIEWTRTWDGAAHGADFAEGITVAADGTVEVDGRSYAGGGRFIPWSERWSAEGQSLGSPTPALAAR